MLLGTFFGLWLLVSQLVGLNGIGELLQNSIWWWVVATLLITQATSVTEAISMSGTVPVAPPIGPLTLLRFAMNFTGMIGGTVATTATVIRFNQRRGLPPGVALSSGIVYSVAGFIVQILLTLVTLCFAAGEFHRESAGASGSGPENLQLILYGVVAVVLRRRHRLRHPQDPPGDRVPPRTPVGRGVGQRPAHRQDPGQAGAHLRRGGGHPADDGAWGSDSPSTQWTPRLPSAACSSSARSLR